MFGKRTRHRGAPKGRRVRTGDTPTVPLLDAGVIPLALLTQSIVMIESSDAPDGYDYYTPRITVPARVIWLNRLFRLVLALLVGVLAWVAHGQPDLQRIAIAAITINDTNPGLYILIVFSSLGIYPIHELVHGIAGYLQGFNVRYGFDWTYLAPFATTYGRPQTRQETLFITLLPLVSLTIVLLLPVIFASGFVAAVLLPPLFINILGSAGDLNTVWKMYHLPTDALLENDRDENTAYYVPSGSS